MTYFLGLRTFTVTRFGPGSYVDGDFVDFVESTFTIEGSAQSASDRALDLLPEGTRTDHRMSLYTKADLRTVQLDPTGANMRRADRVSVDGRDLEVQGRKNWIWDEGACPHYAYTLEEIGKDEGTG